MSEREESQTNGIPRLLDQYKQRRQAWLAQADELVRLRDEARLAAEREAMEIVTAAKRDVRRIVVQARRELLVLTAQLHAAVDAAEQSQREAGVVVRDAVPKPQADLLVAPDAFEPTRDAVLGARREVRSVLDEARAELEALAADASGPLLPSAGTASPESPAERPIPTLDAILGEVARATSAELGSTRDTSVGQWRIDAGHRPATAGSDRAVTAAALASTVTFPVTTSPLVPMPDLRDDLAPSDRDVALVTDSPAHFSEFHSTDAESTQAEVDEPPALSSFGDTGPVDGFEPRVFLAGADDTTRSGSARVWVGLFAATGVLAISGTLWFLSERRGQVLASRPAVVAEAAPNPRPVAGGPVSASPASTTPRAAATTPAGLAVEVRRTAWIRTVVDGKEDSRVYKAGETRQIIGARNVSIRAGDAGAVFVGVDGRPAEPLGPSGTAVTRQYSLQPGGVIVPAVATPADVVQPSAAVSQTAIGPTASGLGAAAAPTTRTDGSPRPAPGASAAAPTPVTAEESAPTPAAADPATATNGSRADLVAAGQQWLDAYQRRDRDAMATTGTETTSIADERSVTERFPAWQQGVRRDLDQVELELTGDTALLTARMVERSADSPVAAQHVSRVSQIWVRRNGRWRIADVRIIGEGRLSQIVR